MDWLWIGTEYSEWIAIGLIVLIQNGLLDNGLQIDKFSESSEWIVTGLVDD